ncbi:hypothetical protein [Streptomyces varsoviensis]|uniref:hypothetical protein n=1 Tax=Streptomyces varsoviensis TaxID=67373 RepID=UPI0004CB7980|nr:hypothetical protein [Streptomyces varsoviensis]
MEAGPRDRPQPQQGNEPEPLAPDGPGGIGGDGRPGGVDDVPGTIRGDASGTIAGDGPAAVADDGPEEGAGSAPESFRDLRPQRRLRIWQLAPIVMLAALGSLMFAFPLAFEFGDGGRVVAMLGLLISCCAAGWGVMAARRVGYTWPGLPPRGSGRRPDWRYVALYTAVAVALVALAVWRVSRLR